MAWEASPSAASAVCTVTDSHLREISGLLATASGYVAINDSNDNSSYMRIYYLDDECQITSSVAYPQRARDPEDLAVAQDGGLWVADTGDNYNAESHRDTVAVWHLAPGSKTPVLYRLTYPDGHHDCEAMLIDGDGLPVLITKELVGSASIYKPSRALEAGTEEGVPLVLVGQFSPEFTTTSNPYGVIGRAAVTGAAISPDRDMIAVRTYSDAYEFDVSDGDVVAALTSDDARVTALPDEPQGESIAYTADGSSFLTISDAESDTSLLRYSRSESSDTPAESDPTEGVASASASASASTKTSEDGALSLAGGRTVGIVFGGLGVTLVLCLMIARRKPQA